MSLGRILFFFSRRVFETIDEVASIVVLTQQYIFSPKQYKIRFKQWGYWKNLSTQHASSLLEMKKSRESLGKPSTFLRSGQKLEQIRIERTIRRSKARASTKEESQPESADSLIAVPRAAGVPEQALPTGIECRTPSPEPHVNDTGDSYDIYRPKQYASFLLEAYNLDAPADSPQQYEQYLDKLKLCEIASRKLFQAYFSWGTQPLPGQFSGLQAFKRRNRWLAVLEPAIVDKTQLCVAHLQNLAITFLNCPKLSLFIHDFVLPALELDERNAQMATLARQVDDFIQMGKDLLNLSVDTISLLQDMSNLTRKHVNHGTAFPARYEDLINPAVLHGSLAMTDDSILSFEPFGFDVSQIPLVNSNTSSPATTTFSPSEVAMSPTTLFDGLSPCTEAEVTISEMKPMATRYYVGDWESCYLRELNLCVSFYHSGNSTAAVTSLRSLAASGSPSTARGKLLTRVVWYCLYCIYQQEGMDEQAGNCLLEAVRGSLHFRDDRGDEWAEVSHLFL